MGKYFKEESEVVEREIYGDTWKFRVLSSGELARLTSKHYDKFTDEVDAVGYVEELIKESLVEVPDAFRKEFLEVKGREWKGEIKDIQDMPAPLYTKLGQVVNEIHSLEVEEKNS